MMKIVAYNYQNKEEELDPNNIDYMYVTHEDEIGIQFKDGTSMSFDCIYFR